MYVRVLLLCAGLWRQQRNDNNRTCWGSLSLFFSVCVFSGDTALRCQSKWELSYSLSLSFGSYGLFSLLAPGNWERFFGAIQSEWSQLVLSVSWVSIRGRFPLKRTKITRTQLAKNLKKKKTNKQKKQGRQQCVLKKLRSLWKKMKCLLLFCFLFFFSDSIAASGCHRLLP